MKLSKLFTLILLSLSLHSIGQQVSPKPYKAYLVSNAHFDSQWNWDVQKSISEYIPKTLEQNLYLLKKYPDYVFNFEGGVKYLWMKEYYPLMYEQIKPYITSGRWHISGSSWDANDTNVPSPESLTRNILYGQHFYMDEFGVKSTDIFLPDCFGFSWTIPTVASHCGLIGFSTQKLQWRTQPFHGDSKMPFDFGLWKGVDGSVIMAAANARNYVQAWKDEDLSTNQHIIDIAKENPFKTAFRYYGTGDTGGSPTIESVRAIEKGVHGVGEVQIISSTSDQLFKDYLPYSSHPELPVYNGELLMDVHGTGCYTSQAAMKLYNRKNELLGDAAERAAVAADWLGAVKYPKEVIADSWKRFIWHQFHDDLTGTSIPRAYEFSWNDELISLKQFENVLTTSVGGVARGLDTRVKGTALVIYNPVSAEVKDVIEVEIAIAKASSISVYNEKGVQVPSQLLSHQNGVAKLLVSVTAPQNGYVVYDVRTGGGQAKSKIIVSGNMIENSIYKVTLDKNGDIGSIVDKRNNKELVATGKSVRLALFTENKSYEWPAWEIKKETIDKEPVSIYSDVKITIAEQGSVRGALCVERKHEGSTFRQYIRLTEGGQDDRIDVVNLVDWQTTNALLKAEFPLAVTNPKAVYDLGVGSIERGNNTSTAYEVCSQSWADLTQEDGNYGVSMLNDSKYGWDKPNDNTVRMTLLHTPKTQGGYKYQDKQDFGQHQFTYSIIGHAGDYRQAKTVLKAEVLNQKAVAFFAQKHVGELGRKFSFAQVDNDCVAIKAIKQAEKSDEYVVRLYETTGKKSQKVSVTFASQVVQANELNGIEEVIGGLSSQGNAVSIEVPAFGIKTFKVKLKSPEGKLTPSVSQSIALKFDVKSASTNAFRRASNFDSKGNSFAAELLPSEIIHNGIRFELGDPDAPNAQRALGDTIYIPQNGDYNKIYFLTASIATDSRVRFYVDQTPHEVVVPYYSGFIGQWGHTGHTEGYMKSAGIAYVGTHLHSAKENKDLPYEFSYMFAIGLDLPKGAKFVVLPSDLNVVLFSATLANDRNTGVVKASNILNVSLPDVKISTEIKNQNLLFRKRVIERSGQTGDREMAEFMFDFDKNTKWCDNSDAKPKFVVVDMGKEQTISRWSVVHAGDEALNMITKEYALEVRSTESEPWKRVDLVSDNRDNFTDRLLTAPTKARFVRLLVTKPEQDEGTIARIYELSVY